MGTHGIADLADKSVAPNTRAAFLSVLSAAQEEADNMLGVRGSSSGETLWVALSSCVFNFSLDGGIEISSRVLLLGNEGEGLQGLLLGLGCRRE